MKFFSKTELKVLGIIFAVLFSISVPNFSLSLRRARDLTRKNDIRALADAAEAYQKKYFYFPDSLELLSEFLPHIPQDPQESKGMFYVYISNGRRYQILASLEDKEQDEYNEVIEKRGISCGLRLCNFGLGYGKTPLDKSLEEYENEINKN